MSDRICIFSKGKYQPRISGIPTGGMYGDTKTCKPYVFPPCEHHQIPGPHGPCDIEYRPTPECVDKCIDDYGKSVEED